MRVMHDLQQVFSNYHALLAQCEHNKPNYLRNVHLINIHLIV